MSEVSVGRGGGGVRKLLAHFRARSGRASELAAALPELCWTVCAGLRAGEVRSTALVALADDPMRLSGDGRPTRAFDGSIELRLDAPDADAQLTSAVEGLGRRLEPWVHADLCAVQIGANRVFIDCEPAPVRYQYCMRRRHDFSPAAYLKRYEEVHSRFGFETRGIEGYTQFHIDPEATQRACLAAGFGVSGVSSVSELHLASVEAFLAQGPHNATIGAGEDEELFVDRPASVMWMSDEVFRIGA